jgi:hypothetical protein
LTILFGSWRTERISMPRRSYAAVNASETRGSAWWSSFQNSAILPPLRTAAPASAQRVFGSVQCHACALIRASKPGAPAGRAADHCSNVTTLTRRSASAASFADSIAAMSASGSIQVMAMPRAANAAVAMPVPAPTSRTRRPDNAATTSSTSWSGYPGRYVS